MSSLYIYILKKVLTSGSLKCFSIFLISYYANSTYFTRFTVTSLKIKMLMLSYSVAVKCLCMSHKIIVNYHFSYKALVNDNN